MYDLDGDEQSFSNESNVVLGYSSSGLSLGAFFTNYITDYIYLSLTREGLTYNGTPHTEAQLETYFAEGVHSFSEYDSSSQNSTYGFDVMVEGSSGVFYHSNLGGQAGSSFEIVCLWRWRQML